MKCDGCGQEKDALHLVGQSNCKQELCNDCLGTKDSHISMRDRIEKLEKFKDVVDQQLINFMCEKGKLPISMHSEILDTTRKESENKTKFLIEGHEFVFNAIETCKDTAKCKTCGLIADGWHIAKGLIPKCNTLSVTKKNETELRELFGNITYDMIAEQVAQATKLKTLKTFLHLLETHKQEKVIAFVKGWINSTKRLEEKQKVLK